MLRVSNRPHECILHSLWLDISIPDPLSHGSGHSNEASPSDPRCKSLLGPDKASFIIRCICQLDHVRAARPKAVRVLSRSAVETKSSNNPMSDIVHSHKWRSDRRTLIGQKRCKLARATCPFRKRNLETLMISRVRRSHSKLTFDKLPGHAIECLSSGREGVVALPLR